MNIWRDRAPTDRSSRAGLDRDVRASHREHGGVRDEREMLVEIV